MKMERKMSRERELSKFGKNDDQRRKYKEIKELFKAQQKQIEVQTREK